jgi:hypothetical protein
MSTNEILTVKKIGRADGEWGCYCPHCKRPIFFSEDDIDDVRGSQYQHASICTGEHCDGWLEIDDSAVYDRSLFQEIAN